MDKKQRPIWFLEKLDKEQPGSMLTVLKNKRAVGMSFPVAAEAALSTAKD
jgi:hypothetical protein